MHSGYRVQVLVWRNKPLQLIELRNPGFERGAEFYFAKKEKNMKITSLTMHERQEAIHFIKSEFKKSLSKRLKLLPVVAPYFIESGIGYQDELGGTEKPISFHISGIGKSVEIPHSLAKWKREAVARYGCEDGTGLVVDGAYLRPDEEELDRTHSVFVDQWDWERVMKPSERKVAYLENVIKKIHAAMLETQTKLLKKFPILTPFIAKEISFVTAQELETLYPEMTSKQREYAWVKNHPFSFIRGIGGRLQSGKPHDRRAPDYDSWVDVLNGDIVVYHPVLDDALELSSMGIRVNKKTLCEQSAIAGTESKLCQEYHQKILHGKLPQTIGGGIGQSRLVMQMLGAAHIGEVQPIVHSDETIKELKSKGVVLL